MLKSIKKKWLFLFLIVIVATLLRFYKLGEVPSSLNADEVAIGYNAYSILKTGRDEYNRLLPYQFQSFDDYKLPVYVYLTVPSIAVFGLHDFSVRFPSAVFGTLTVLVVYFLVKGLRLKIFYQDREEKYHEMIPILSSFLLAISPWHLQFSRSAYEANIAVFFAVFGTACFLYSYRNKWLYSIGFIFFSLSVWSYHSSRIFVPLFICAYSVAYIREILKSKLQYFLGAGLCLFLCFPLLLSSLSSTGLVRARGVSALDDPTLASRNVSWRQTDIYSHIPFSNIFHNHRLVNVSIVLKGYLDHYSPNFFFSEMVQNKYHAPGMGLLYLWELPIFLFGMYVGVGLRNKGMSLIFFWFLIAPIAASVTHMLPHPVRTLIFLPTPQIFIALGLAGIYRKILGYHKYTEKIFICSAVIAIFGSSMYYLHQYYIHLPIDYALDWQYGHEQVVDKISSVKSKFKKVVVSTTLDQPYIFFLYYLHYDPATYLQFGGTKSGKFDEERNAFDIYEFHSYMKADEKVDPNTLYVGTPIEMLPGTYPLVDIKDPSGTVVYSLYSTISKAEWNKRGMTPHLD